MTNEKKSQFLYILSAMLQRKTYLYSFRSCATNVAMNGLIRRCSRKTALGYSVMNGVTHIADTLMEDKRHHSSRAIVWALEDILTVIRLLRDEAAADIYPIKHDIHVISEKIRSFVFIHES